MRSLGLLAIAFLPAVVHAQSSRAIAVVQGVVEDASGAPIPAARIVLKNQDTGAERRSEADPFGHFSISGLPPGTYALRLEAPGFATATVKPFLLSVGQVLSQRLEQSGRDHGAR
jgi:hypothetical protein